MLLTRTNGVRLFAIAAVLSASSAAAQTNVTYGKITAVKPVSVTQPGPQAGGALVGGMIGLATGSGQSSSNRALRAAAGGVAGQQVARAASTKQAFEYTVLRGAATVTVVTDEAGLRVGDCVALEQGQYVNLRLAADSQCTPRAKPSATATRHASECTAAKNEVANAKDDESFNLAERKMRLLCAD